MKNPHIQSILQALFVTFLWSTSWVFIKIGLDDIDIPALTFAGLRYVLAFLCLLPFVFRHNHLTTIRQLSRQQWGQLITLGVIFYAVTQGAQFLGLAYLPAITTNLLLSFTTIVVTLLGIFILAEKPNRFQVFGMSVYSAGVSIFFYPASLPTDQRLGLGIVLLGVLANAASALLGRAINRKGSLSPLVITVVSMGIGSIVLLAAGIIIQGLPNLGLQGWAIVIWLAVVNTAFAFTLWNHTLRSLSAMESSLINNAMMIQIPLLALLFLGEDITLQKAVGMTLAGIGIVAVQLWRTPNL